MTNHHYAIDAAKLLEKCHVSLHSILDYLEGRSKGSNAFRRRAFQLIELNDGELFIGSTSCVNESSLVVVCDGE